ncbi:MAG: helix-turn-helix domain-containing protein [Methylococcaceae bacterium]
MTEKTELDDDDLKRIEIGKRIHKSIRMADLTNTDVAKIMGVSPQAVQQWCAGKTSPKLAQLPRLASVLNVTVSFIVLGEVVDNLPIKEIPESSDILRYMSGLTIEQQKVKIREIKDQFLENIKIFNEMNQNRMSHA